MAYHLSTEFEAIKHDINTLFSNFHEKQSVRFEDFCVEWRNMNFSSIFGATTRNTVAAKMRIVERLFRAASEFLSEESTFLYRVATIYTFYGVYFKQVTSTKVKIRMTPTMWTDLMKFVDILLEHQHFDVVYIIHTLCNQKAFMFTAFPKELFFGRFEFMMGLESFGGFKNLQERNQYLNDVLDDNGLISRMKSIHSEYNSVKLKLLSESKEEEKDDLSRVLFYSNSEFPSDISKIVANHKRKYKDNSSSLTDESNDSVQRPSLSQLHQWNEEKDTKNNFEHVETRAETISKLKERIWSSDIKKEKGSRYHVDTAPKTVISDGDTENESKILYKKSAMIQPSKNALTRKKKSPSLRYKYPDDDE